MGLNNLYLLRVIQLTLLTFFVYCVTSVSSDTLCSDRFCWKMILFETKREKEVQYIFCLPIYMHDTAVYASHSLFRAIRALFSLRKVVAQTVMTRGPNYRPNLLSSNHRLFINAKSLYPLIIHMNLQTIFDVYTIQFKDGLHKVKYICMLNVCIYTFIYALTNVQIKSFVDFWNSIIIHKPKSFSNI